LDQASSALPKATSALVEAMNAAFEARFAADQVWSGTDEACGNDLKWKWRMGLAPFGTRGGPAGLRIDSPLMPYPPADWNAGPPRPGVTPLPWTGQD